VKPFRTLLLCVALLASTLISGAERADLPDISWTCPMHPDVVEAHKGKCPICRMNLVPVRLDYAWSCPVHAVIDEDHEGRCPICGRELVRVTVELSFTCPDNPKIKSINPGKCPDGSAMVPKHTARAHGNHNPQHGGMFFMASDSWHHLEGTYPQAGLFRVYLYDDYSKPLPADPMKQVAGTVTNKNSVVPLKMAADGKSFEAKLDRAAIPAELTAKVRFKQGGPEYRFDFVFQQYSQDPNASVPSTNVVPIPLRSIEIPDSLPEILKMLSDRREQVRQLIDKGSFGEIYVAAFQAKDLALALDFRTRDLASADREAAKTAIEQVVRSAWQLDNDGDLGDRKLIDEAFGTFSSALDEIQTIFRPRR